jgi:HNH endonuclease/AP2 domain
MGAVKHDKQAQHRRLEQRYGAALDNRESVMKIKLHGKYGEGKYALVDAIDYPELSKYKWNGTRCGYAARTAIINGKPKVILMHRQILNVPDGLVTDHINGDKLDNRRSNLRIATRAQNNYNVDSRKPSISGFKGVSWDRAKNKWQARITKDGKGMHLGYFDDPVFAAKVYDYYATKLFGEFAKLNFPDDVMTYYEKKETSIK